MAHYLYVSDDPETFTDRGLLLSGDLQQGASYRILFDHVNGASTDNRRVVVEFTNPSSTSVVCGVSGVTSNADPNGLEAGHDVTCGYLQAMAAGALQTIAIPAHGSVVYKDTLLKPGECVCGLVDVHVLSGFRAAFRVFAVYEHESTAAGATLQQLPSGPLGRRGKYDIDLASRPISVSYSYGDMGDETPLGGLTVPNLMPIPTVPKSMNSRGEYGIVKTLDCTLVNPTAAGQSMFLYQRSGGNFATATYIFDSNVVQSHKFTHGPRIQVCRFDLSAGETRNVKIVTMTEINSETPLVLSFGPDDPAAIALGAAASPIHLA
jgi:hypothetical protein